MRKDPRRWATIKVPDEARQSVQQALWLSERMTGSSVEAWEAIAQEFISSAMPAFIQQAEEAQDEYEVSCMLAHIRDQWRCVLCGTSKNLQAHHVTPRSECRQMGRLDLLVSVENLATLCARCHEEITPYHRDEEIKVRLYKAIGVMSERP